MNRQDINNIRGQIEIRNEVLREYAPDCTDPVKRKMWAAIMTGAEISIISHMPNVLNCLEMCMDRIEALKSVIEWLEINVIHATVDHGRREIGISEGGILEEIRKEKENG